MPSNNNQLRENLISILREKCIPSYFNTPHTELRIRCPYCGDSVKSNKSAHLYIDITNTDIFPYYCQRCNTAGIVNSDFLKDLNIHDFNISAKLNKVNKNKKYNIKKVKGNTVYSNLKNQVKLKVPPYNEERDYEKLNYINNRFGLNHTGEYWVKNYYVIFNYYDFAKLNDITKLNFYNKDFALDVINNYVGFLSHDHSHIVFRNIKQGDIRYYNYNIYNNPEGKKFYIPKRNINTMSKKLNLIITEGIFDIIGVKEHLYQDNDSNDTIFVSANGKGYNFIIKYFARLGFTNMNIMIYSDSDVKINFYKNLKSTNIIANNNTLKIYYNNICKDYGVTKENIDLYYSEL